MHHVVRKERTENVQHANEGQTVLVPTKGRVDYRNNPLEQRL